MWEVGDASVCPQKSWYQIDDKGVTPCTSLLPLMAARSSQTNSARRSSKWTRADRMTATNMRAHPAVCGSGLRCASAVGAVVAPALLLLLFLDGVFEREGILVLGSSSSSRFTECKGNEKRTRTGLLRSMQPAAVGCHPWYLACVLAPPPPPQLAAAREPGAG